MDFSPETMAGWLPYLLGGLWISLKVTAGCIAFGLPLGLVLALAVSSRSRPLRLVSLALVEIGRGTPGLIMLEFVYYGLPQIGLTLGTCVAAIAALSWTTGAYTSEIIRAGLEAVPFGQRQAAIAIGLNPLDRLRFVILPQALRIAVPALLGFAILIFQGTSLCYAISTPELISRAYEIGANTFQYFPVLVLAGMLYAAISIPGSLIVGAIERRMGRHAMR